jgi:hypothetical protein
MGIRSSTTGLTYTTLVVYTYHQGAASTNLITVVKLIRGDIE